MKLTYGIQVLVERLWLSLSICAGTEAEQSHYYNCKLLYTMFEVV